jgi:hypothetical protein
LEKAAIRGTKKATSRASQDEGDQDLREETDAEGEAAIGIDPHVPPWR